MSRPPPQKNVALARDGMCSKKTSSSALAVFHECDRRTDGRTDRDGQSCLAGVHASRGKWRLSAETPTASPTANGHTLELNTAGDAGRLWLTKPIPVEDPCTMPILLVCLTFLNTSLLLSSSSYIYSEIRRILRPTCIFE